MGRKVATMVRDLFALTLLLSCSAARAMIIGRCEMRPCTCRECLSKRVGPELLAELKKLWARIDAKSGAPTSADEDELLALIAEAEGRS